MTFVLFPHLAYTLDGSGLLLKQVDRVAISVHQDCKLHPLSEIALQKLAGLFKKHF